MWESLSVTRRTGVRDRAGASGGLNDCCSPSFAKGEGSLIAPVPTFAPNSWEEGAVVRINQRQELKMKIRRGGQALAPSFAKDAKLGHAPLSTAITNCWLHGLGALPAK